MIFRRAVLCGDRIGAGLLTRRVCARGSPEATLPDIAFGPPGRALSPRAPQPRRGGKKGLRPILPMCKRCQFQCCQLPISRSPSRPPSLEIGIGYWQHFLIGNIPENEADSLTVMLFMVVADYCINAQAACRRERGNRRTRPLPVQGRARHRKPERFSQTLSSERRAGQFYVGLPPPP